VTEYLNSDHGYRDYDRNNARDHYVVRMPGEPDLPDDDGHTGDDWAESRDRTVRANPNRPLKRLVPGGYFLVVFGPGWSASAIAVSWSRNGPTRSPSWAWCRNGLSGCTV